MANQTNPVNQAHLDTTHLNQITQVNFPLNSGQILDLLKDYSSPRNRRMGVDAIPTLMEMMQKDAEAAGKPLDVYLAEGIIDSQLEAIENATNGEFFTEEFAQFIAQVLEKIDVSKLPKQLADRLANRFKNVLSILLVRKADPIALENFSKALGDFASKKAEFGIAFIILIWTNSTLSLKKSREFHVILDVFLSHSPDIDQYTMSDQINDFSELILQLLIDGDLVEGDLIIRFLRYPTALGNSVITMLKKLDIGSTGILIRLQGLARRMAKNPGIESPLYIDYSKVIENIWGASIHQEVFGNIAIIEAFHGRPDKAAQLNQLKLFLNGGLDTLLTALSGSEAKLISLFEALEQGFVGLNVLDFDESGKEILTVFLQIFVKISKDKSSEVWKVFRRSYANIAPKDAYPLKRVSGKLASTVGLLDSQNTQIATNAGELVSLLFTEPAYFTLLSLKDPNDRVNVFTAVVEHFIDHNYDVHIIKDLIDSTVKNANLYGTSLNDALSLIPVDRKITLVDEIYEIAKTVTPEDREVLRKFYHLLFNDPNFAEAYQDYRFEKRSEAFDTLSDRVIKIRDGIKERTDADIKAEMANREVHIWGVGNFVNNALQGRREKVVLAENENTLVASVHDLYLLVAEKNYGLYMTAQDPKMNEVFVEIAVRISKILAVQKPEEAINEVNVKEAIKEANIIMSYFTLTSGLAQLLPVEVLATRINRWSMDLQNYESIRDKYEVLEAGSLPQRKSIDPRGFFDKKQRNTKLGNIAEEMTKPKNLVLFELVKIIRTPKLLEVYLGVPGFTETLQDTFEIMASRPSLDDYDRRLLTIIISNGEVWNLLSDKTKFEFCTVLYQGISQNNPGYGELLHTLTEKQPPANLIYKHKEFMAFFAASYRFLETEDKSAVEKMLNTISTRKPGLRDRVLRKQALAADTRYAALVKEVVDYSNYATKATAPEVIEILIDIRSSVSVWKVATQRITDMDSSSVKLHELGRDHALTPDLLKQQSTEALKLITDTWGNFQPDGALLGSIEFGTEDEAKLLKFLEEALESLFKALDPFDPSRNPELDKFIKLLNTIFDLSIKNLTEKSAGRVIKVISDVYNNTVNVKLLNVVPDPPKKSIEDLRKTKQESFEKDKELALFDGDITEFTEIFEKDQHLNPYRAVEHFRKFFDKYAKDPQLLKRMLERFAKLPNAKIRMERLLTVLLQQFYRFDRYPWIFNEVMTMIDILIANAPKPIIKGFSPVHAAVYTKVSAKLNKKVGTQVADFIRRTSALAA